MQSIAEEMSEFIWSPRSKRQVWTQKGCPLSHDCPSKYQIQEHAIYEIGWEDVRREIVRPVRDYTFPSPRWTNIS